jgi:hypothetical protein
MEEAYHNAKQIKYQMLASATQRLPRGLKEIAYSLFLIHWGLLLLWYSWALV